jgi:hypothetical protein
MKNEQGLVVSDIDIPFHRMIALSCKWALVLLSIMVLAYILLVIVANVLLSLDPGLVLP